MRPFMNRGKDDAIGKESRRNKRKKFEASEDGSQGFQAVHRCGSLAWNHGKTPGKDIVSSI